MADINMLWHTTAMAADYDNLLGPLQRLFGAVVMHDHWSDAPGVGRRGGMIWIGDNSIEIGAPVGEQSPVRNFVERWGGGMHSIALHVDDARANVERLNRLNVSPQAWIDDHIMFTRPGDTAGLLLEWSARNTEDDPRWGYPLNELLNPPVVPTQQYAFVTAVVADPPAVAARLAEVLGTGVLRVNPHAAPDQVGAVVSLVDNLLLLFPLSAAADTEDLWGSSITRNRFHAHGLRVADLPGALTALEAVGVRQVATVAGMAYLDPKALPIPTFLCQELLPDDPRRAEA